MHVCKDKCVCLLQNDTTVSYLFQKHKKKHKNPSAVNFSALHLINDPQGKPIIAITCTFIHILPVYNLCF